MTDATREVPDLEEQPFAEDTLVVEDRRGSRVGIVVRSWEDPPPILYKLAGPRGGAPWLAWHHHLREANETEQAAYEAARADAVGPPRPA